MKDLLLKDLKWNNDASWVVGDMRIRQGKIQAIGFPLEATKQDKVISFNNHVVYPGLVNSHDHLEMNLYPRMGNPPYQNYTQWAKDIYRPLESPVREIERVPLKDRLLWGGIKNLISGVTTVVHHNPFHRNLRDRNFPTRVLHDYSWAHSLAFEKTMVRKFPKSPSTPFIVHAAEGIDALAHGEIQQLVELHVLRANTVLIHAIGLSEQDRVNIQQSGASVVWCPSSNLFMFDRTADVALLRSRIPVVLGTDSTMTGKATLFDEMAVALNTGQASPLDILDMVTKVPRKIFGLPAVTLQTGQPADLLILHGDQKDYAENLVAGSSQRVAAVLVEGEIRFGDPDIVSAAGGNNFGVTICGKSKSIRYDVVGLMKRLSAKTGSEFFNVNSLWTLFGN